MLKPYRTIADVLSSPWAAMSRQKTVQDAGTDRVLRSTKLEDNIYADLRTNDADLLRTEQEAKKKLTSFSALSRDVYQSFYSLMPKRNSEDSLSTTARKFNVPILEHVTGSEDYPTLKSICEGRELPAYEAASEFISRTAGELDDLLSGLGGEKGAVSTLEKLERAQRKSEEELASLLEQLQRSHEKNETLEQAVVDAANNAAGKQRQVEAVSKLVDAGAARSKDAVTALVAKAVSAATEKAEEVQSILSAWGDAGGRMEKNEVNTELLSLIRQNKDLKDVTRYLGRFREIFAQGKRNGYAYGRGEKYALELGRDLSRAITAELAMLATPETLPLFLRKYQCRQIKQYRRRQPIYKGMGDIICCLDESSSTRGDPAAWGKAVALTLLEIAAENGRSFALIHFSGPGSQRTDVFRPGAYTTADKVSAAECFLAGGTDFETPMRAAINLIEFQGFENADVVFITDGECAMGGEYLEQLQVHQMVRCFSVTGILLDNGTPGMDFSLKNFCQNIYRTSELMGDKIVQRLVNDRI